MWQFLNLRYDLSLKIIKENYEWYERRWDFKRVQRRAIRYIHLWDVDKHVGIKDRVQLIGKWSEHRDDKKIKMKINKLMWIFAF